MRSLIRQVVLIALGVSFAAPCTSQQQAEIYPAYKQYSIAEGLAQPQIRHIHIDHTGYVWIGTQGGLSGFDGSTVRTFEHQGELAQEYIISLISGDSAIWGSTLDRIFRFDGKSVHFYDIPKHAFSRAIVYLLDAFGNLWFMSNSEEFIIVQDTVLPLAEKYPTLAGIEIKKAASKNARGKAYIVDTMNRLFAFDPVRDELTEIETPFNPSDLVYFNSYGSYFKHPLTGEPDIMVYQGLRQGFQTLYAIRQDKLVKLVQKNPRTGNFQGVNAYAPNCITQTTDAIHQVLTLQDSVYQYHPNLQFEQLRFILNHEDRTYLGTDEGFIVIYFNGLENVDIRGCNYPWSVTRAAGDHAYVGCYTGGVFDLDPAGSIQKHYRFSSPKFDGFNSYQLLSNSLLHDGKLYLGGNGGFNICDPDKPLVRLVRRNYAIEAFAYDETQDMILVANDRIQAYDPAADRFTSFVEVPTGILGRNWVNDMEIQHDSVYWAACSKGILRMHGWNGRMETFTSGNGRLDCLGAITIDIDARGRVWAGGTCGLMQYDPDQDRFEQVLPDLISKRVNQVMALPGDRLACVHANQVTILDCSAEPPEPIAVLDDDQGVNLQEPSENGIALTADRYLWIPSNSGIQRLDLDRLEKEDIRPQFRIYEINDQPVPLAFDKPACFEVSDRYALIDLSIVDHKANQWQYRYRIEDQAFTPWQSSNELLVSGLVHGKNEVTIQANWLFSDPSKAIEETVSIRTHIPFLQRASTRNLFMTGLILLSIVVFLIILRNQRTQRKMNTLRTELYLNRLRTIQAYFNPHFLFNALTTLQDYILHHDRRESSKMVVRLSNIFRKVLHSGVLETPSRVPMIPLSEELGFILDMVELQNKQYPNPVKLEMKIDSAVEEADPLVPPMLIQPFVENAFKHAFRKEDQEKVIRVVIEKKDTDLVISVIDNGIGMEKGKHHENSTTLGLKLARERMDLLNSLGIPNQISIAKEQPHGTLVAIQIEENHESNHR